MTIPESDMTIPGQTRLYLVRHDYRWSDMTIHESDMTIPESDMTIPGET